MLVISLKMTWMQGKRAEIMHESAIVAGLLRILTDRARPAGVARITVVRLTLGRLRGLDPRQIRGAFEIFTEDTLAEGARLEIDERPVRALCKACGTAYEVQGYRFECPACASADADVTEGRELFIESFDGEKS
jgi:hydrogenase nickel incorporation protein HypA/HybF